MRAEERQGLQGSGDSCDSKGVKAVRAVPEMVTVGLYCPGPPHSVFWGPWGWGPAPGVVVVLVQGAVGGVVTELSAAEATAGGCVLDALLGVSLARRGRSALGWEVRPGVGERPR
jgi:hypothetical protein